MDFLYSAVDGGGETQGVFSTLAIAKNVIEKRILADIREGYYGRNVKDQTPELIWRDLGAGHHVCGFVRGSTYFLTAVEWRSCDPAIYTIELDPESI